MMEKAQLRSMVRSLKKQHSQAQLAQMSEAICSKILACSAYRNAETILLYHPLPDEVDTRIIIHNAYSSGKKVILPVVAGSDLELRAYVADSMSIGAFGIMEPTGPLFTQYSQISLAIIPGMGFDSQNHRLGRGKGYYDRLLPRLQNATKMGVCFGFQYLDQIPCEPHDIQMDLVIKE